MGSVGAPPISTLDPDILLWCERNGFILVTNNRASMPIHLKDHLDSDHHMPGIFILNRNMSIGDSIKELILVSQTALLDEYQDAIHYLPISYDLAS